MSERDEGFRQAIELSANVDPTPPLKALAELAGVDVQDVIHHAAVRWVSAGSEALLAAGPLALRELVEAWRRHDLAAVGGIIDWLDATLMQLT